MFDTSSRDDGGSNLVGPRIPCGGSIQIDLFVILALAVSLRLLTETKSFFFSLVFFFIDLADVGL